MGGSGSGSYYRHSSEETVDGLKCLDINWLNRSGYLKPGLRSCVHWWRGTEHSGSINIYAEEASILLDYKTRFGDGDWESVTERVLLSFTHCNYGGRRLWFICPGVKNGVPCRRRVAKLYSAGKYFLCRHCYGYHLACICNPQLHHHSGGAAVHYCNTGHYLPGTKSSTDSSS